MQNKVFKNFFKAFLPVISAIIFICPVFCEVQETFYITAEDILNAQPKTPDVKFTKKEYKEIAVMEKRHFEKVNRYDSEKYRIAKLEEYLLGRTWEFLPVQDRMRKLKLASQRKVLAGTSLPPSLRRAGFTPKRIANDSTPKIDHGDNVGILDGLLRLASPDAYNAYIKHKEEIYEKYED